MTKKNIKNDSLTLAPERISNAEEILKISEKKVKFNFKIQFNLIEKDFLFSEIKRIGGVVKKELEENIILASLSMEQLAGVKTLTCIEKVEVYHTISNTSEEQANKKTLHTNDSNDIITTNEYSARSLSSNIDTNGVMLLSSNDNCDEDTYSNTMENAYDLPIGYWRKADIICPYGEIWFKFTVAEGTAYYNIFSDSDNSFDCMCFLYGSSGEYIDKNDDDVGTTNFRLCKKLENGMTYFLRVRGFAFNTGRTWVKIEKACGGNNYTDVNKHTMEYHDGYYTCSKCGYRVMSPVLQDESVLSTEDYYRVLGCYLAVPYHLTMMSKKNSFHIDPVSILAKIDDIRSKDEYKNKYQYVDSSGVCKRLHTEKEYTYEPGDPISNFGFLNVNHVETTKSNLWLHNGVADALINFAFSFFVPSEYKAFFAAATADTIYDGATYLLSDLAEKGGYPEIGIILDLINLGCSDDPAIEIGDNIVYVRFSTGVETIETKIVFSSNGTYKAQYNSYDTMKIIA